MTLPGLHLRFLGILLGVWMGVACSTKAPEFDVKFGQVGIRWEGDQPRQVLLEETTVVPRDVGGDTALGFVIYPSSDQAYDTYSIHHLPENPAHLGSAGTLKSTADGGIRTDTERAQGPRVFSFAFDEGDPLGMYTMDVYVNDRLVESASIQVVDPAAK
jgi:hypothetical protein